MVTPFMLSTVVVAASFAAALAALLILSVIPRRSPAKPSLANLAAPLEQAIFLFEDRDLVDATRAGRSLLNAIAGSGTEWTRLSGYLSQRFEDFEEEMAALPDRGVLELDAMSDAGLKLYAEWLGQHARLTVTDLTVEGQGILVDGLSQRAQEEELSALRETLASAPILVWRTDHDDSVIWANHAYLDSVAEILDLNEDDMTWPIPALFSAPADAAPQKPRREKLQSEGDKVTHWYQIHQFPSGDGHLNFALSSDGEMRAETALREFIQTLTKTFAHLPIGLAIFDRQRQLALFNPALVDLTSIGAEFLSARPTLFSFLDGLREARVIPEPKDYSHWRQQMAELEKAAASGLYEDTWSLPSGQTYKVTGRPHPDGAVALLIEDISAEVTLTRHFRSEIEIGQAVVDALDEAIAVFSPAGELILSNASYEALWHVDSSATLSTISIADSTCIWQGLTIPSPVFGEIRDFVTTIDERVEWNAELTLTDGDTLACRCAPLPGGATLIGFERCSSHRPIIRRTRRRRPSDAATASDEHVQA